MCIKKINTQKNTASIIFFHEKDNMAYMILSDENVNIAIETTDVNNTKIILASCKKYLKELFGKDAPEINN